MDSVGIFPFGEPVLDVVQADRTPKRVFVLGVYASAVHARWVGSDNKTRVTALAIASEPYIFWKGDKADEIIEKVNKKMPPGIGKLVSPNDKLNGPSGNVLDKMILTPLGLKREEAWLCDLVPHSCMNPAQEKAIERSYTPLRDKHGLATPSVPKVPNELADKTRREDILSELKQSQATKLILLGDQPIHWFLEHYEPHWKRLSDFMKGEKSYGEFVSVKIDDQQYDVLPLAHPRQIGGLGLASKVWKQHHADWVAKRNV